MKGHFFIFNNEEDRVDKATRICEINGKETQYHLMGEKKNAYPKMKKQLTYLGKGTYVSEEAEVLERPFV